MHAVIILIKCTNNLLAKIIDKKLTREKTVKYHMITDKKQEIMAELEDNAGESKNHHSLLDKIAGWTGVNSIEYRFL